MGESSSITSISFSCCHCWSVSPSALRRRDMGTAARLASRRTPSCSSDISVLTNSTFAPLWAAASAAEMANALLPEPVRAPTMVSSEG